MSMIDKNVHIQRIPPFTRQETIDFYATGKVPERFHNIPYEMKKQILHSHGVTNISKPGEAE